MRSLNLKLQLCVSLFLFLFFSLSFLGCPARSLNPLFGEKEIKFNSALLGTWAEGKDSYTFEQSGEKGYLVTFREEKSDGEGKEPVVHSTKYKAAAGQIGKFWFLDSFPAEGVTEFHFVAGHLITRIWLNGDTLRMASLESDWLRNMIDAKKLKISHVRREAEIILTASSAELRKLVERYANDRKAFPEPGTLVRVGK